MGLARERDIRDSDMNPNLASIAILHSEWGDASDTEKTLENVVLVLSARQVVGRTRREQRVEME